MERSDKEVVTSINSIFPEFPFTMQDVQHPDAKRTRQLYMHCCGLILNEEIEFNFGTKPGDYFGETENEILAVLRTVRTLFSRIPGSPPVTMADIIMPRADSVRKIVSNIVNFYAFQESIEEQMHAYVVEAVKLKNFTDGMENSVAEKERQLHEARVQSEAFKMEEEQIEAEMSTLTERITELEIRKQSLVINLRKIEESFNTAEEESDKLNSILAEREAEIEKLKKMIVEDPEELKREFEQVQSIAGEISAEIKDRQIRVRQLDDFLAEVKRKKEEASEKLIWIRELKKISVLIQQRQEELPHLLTALREAEFAVSGAREINVKGEQVLVNLQRLFNEETTAQAKLKEEIEQIVSKLHNKQEEADKKLAENNIIVSECSAKVRLVNDNLESMKNSTQAKENDIQSQIEFYKKKAREICDEFNKWVHDVENDFRTRLKSLKKA